MGLYVAIACFGLAALGFLNGVVTEYRQSRRVGPYAIVPTLPWAVAAALLLALGLASLRLGVPWWAFPLVFVAASAGFGYGIILADAGRNSRTKRRQAKPGPASDRRRM